MKIRPRNAQIAAAVAALLSSGAIVQAADLTWDVDPVTAGVQDGGGNWDTATANWFDGVNNVTWSNATPDSATFGNDANTFNNLTAPSLIDFAENLTVQNLTLSVASDGGVYHISEFSGGTLTLAGNITKSASAGNMQIFLSSAPLNLTAGNHTFAVNDTGGEAAPELTVNAAIVGAGDVTVDNGTYDAYGIVAFNFDNTYTGATNISKGKLIITTAGGLGATSAGTTISNTGRLSIGGANTTVVGGLNIAEPITITRDTYGTPTSEIGSAAIIVNNNGAAATHTLSGALVVDSADARISVNTNTLVIPTNITQVGVTPRVLSFTGDFAGFVQLTGNNTALLGGIKLVSAVEVQFTDFNQLGGASAPLTFGHNGSGDATLGVMNPLITDFGTLAVNYSTFSGGLNIPTGQVFNISQNLGTSGSGQGSLGKRGGGTLNLSGTNNLTGGSTYFDAGVVNITGSTTLQSLHLRSPVVNINSGGVVTTAGENSFGESSYGTSPPAPPPDNATVNINGTGQLISNHTGDFFLSNAANTQGTINLNDSGVLTISGLMHVARSAGAQGTINQTGGTFNLTRTGNFTLVLGSRHGTGTYNLSAGTMNSAGEFYVGQGVTGGTGTGVFTMTGGTVNQNNVFAIGREGGMGTVDISAGTFNKTGGGNSYIDQGAGVGPSSMTIRGTASYLANSGEFWVGRGAGSNGTLTMEDTGALTTNNWTVVGRNAGEGGGTGTVTMSDNATITKATGGGNHFIIGDGGGSTGTVTLSDSSSISVNAGELWVGQGGGTGSLTIQNSAAVSVNNWVAIGRGGGTGTVTMSGGTFTKTGTSGNRFIVAAGGGSNGTFTQTGGTLTNLGSATWINEGAANGVWTLSGSAVANLAAVRIVEAGGGSGTINLNGGTLTATSVTGGGGGTKTFNFNGGTLRAGASSATFMQGLTTANVQNGGAIIDSNGNNITIAQQLVSAGTGGLTKNGAGTLTVNNVRLPSLTVNTATVKAAAQANPYVVASEAGTSKVTTLTASTGLIDLTNTKIITQDASMVATPVYDGINDVYVYDGVHGLVQKARGDGTWNGTSGITTSETDATTGVFTSLAVGTGAELRGLGPTDTELFAGQTINGDSTVVMYTYGGDADMDGDLDGDDYFYLDSNVLQSETVFGWHQGDFNYDGRLNGDDYFILDSNILQAQASGNVFWVRPPEFSSSGGAAGLTAVPEPASIGLLGLAASGLLGRRRRGK